MASFSPPPLPLSTFRCPICVEDFNSARVLDCGHSFCLRCLQDLCRDKMPGTRVQCPLCRVEFVIPRNGPEGLTPNFALQDLIDAKCEFEETRTEARSTDKQPRGGKVVFV